MIIATLYKLSYNITYATDAMKLFKKRKSIYCKLASLLLILWGVGMFWYFDILYYYATENINYDYKFKIFIFLLFIIIFLEYICYKKW